MKITFYDTVSEKMVTLGQYPDVPVPQIGGLVWIPYKRSSVRPYKVDEVIYDYKLKQIMVYGEYKP